MDRIGELSAQGVQLHADGQYQEAEQACVQALDLARDSRDIRYGGLLTQLAASADRQGNLDEGLSRIQESYDFLTHAQSDTERSGQEQSVAKEQLPAAAIYLGTLLTKKAIKEESDKTVGLAYADEAWEKVRQNRRNEGFNPHQHEINMSRRVSIIRSLGGRVLSGIGVGVKALVLAPLSESPMLATHTSDRSVQERWLKDKPKAVLGATAAIGVGVLTLIPTRWTRRHARALALRSL